MKLISLYTLSSFFVATGLSHFVWPRPFLKMMPPWVPRPREVNRLVGAAEFGLALGLLIPGTRVTAAWGLIALLVAVFPANVRMATHPEASLGVNRFLLWLRLPLQGLLIAWVWNFISYHWGA